MSRRQIRRSLWVIFRFPFLLALLSLIGLISALVGDGVWDMLAWLTLAIPIAVIAWALRSAFRPAPQQ